MTPRTMFVTLSFVTALLATILLLPLVEPIAVAAQAPAAPAQAAGRPKILFDGYHGRPLFSSLPSGQPAPLRQQYGQIAESIAVDFTETTDKLTPTLLSGYRTLVLMSPMKPLDTESIEAIAAFVRGGGSLLVGIDEERRQPVAPSRLNDLIAQFGMTFTGDTPYIHNRGAIAKAGRINQTDREIPYSGGRAVAGGTPFSLVIEADGTPSTMAHAAWLETPSGGRIVAMGDLMAPLLLGQPEGKRLFGGLVPGASVYWGRDSVPFMTEVLSWLTHRSR